jgi:hypothetical protein
MNMPALNKQPFPDSRIARAAWLRGEIRAEHAKLLTLVPALPEGEDARLQVVWEAVAIKAGELRVLCAELSGLELAK